MASEEIVQIGDNQLAQPKTEERLTRTVASVPRSLVSSGTKVNKKAITAFLVVATLIASVTFGAACTRSFDNLISDPDIDVWRYIAVRVFFLCDVGAMCTSIFAIVFLFGAQIGDDKLAAAALEFSTALIGISLLMMTTAVTVGVIIIVRKVPWMQYTLSCFGAVYISILLVLLMPLFVLHTNWAYPISAITLYWRQRRSTD